jgi:4'-phosphopantetheinyl transferase EntD
MPSDEEIADLSLRLALSAHPALTIGCPALRSGDESALFPVEMEHLANATAMVRRARGSVRIVARTLLKDLGCSDLELPRAANQAPRWPKGFVGSMAHDSEFAVAEVGPDSAVASVGIDIEPAQPAAAELMETIATPAEREQLRGDLIALRLLFCIKEAVYKRPGRSMGYFWIITMLK